MRYLLPLLLTFNFACGEESARPRTKQNKDADLVGEMSDMSDMLLDSGVEDMGCVNALDCMSDEEIQDKMLNLLRPSEHGGFDGRFEFEPQPFEFDFEDEDEEQKG